MQTKLSPEFAQTADGQGAKAIVQRCVHCGFCNATCPTYQLLGDELDGPRGRIYLIKELLEGGAVTRKTQVHLDRCLTCRNCETTCPSGVEFGKLVDIGRRLVEERVHRPIAEQAVRWTLKEGLTSRVFGAAMKLGQRLRPLLPHVLQAKVPVTERTGEALPASRKHDRKVLLLAGCVQPAMRPAINRATERVLDVAAIQSITASGAGCCGALRTHLNDREGGLAEMRRNIDVWWPYVAAGAVESIVINASGCSLMVKEYGEALRGDPVYAEKAVRIAGLARDLSELLPDLLIALKSRLDVGATPRLALHEPCTLQHGQRLGGIATPLRALGFDVALAQEHHLCCGSAGTYSILQPVLANELRDRKLENLQGLGAAGIVSANIGCIAHLQSGTTLPVRHWIEVLDKALP